MNLYINKDQIIKHIFAGSQKIWKVYKGSSKVWQLNKVNFMDWDSTVLKYEEVVSGNPATPPPDPTREGYTFAGWEGSWTDIQTDTEIIATYTPNYITLTYDSNDGEDGFLVTEAYEPIIGETTTSDDNIEVE